MEKTLSKNSTDYVIRVKNDGSQEPVLQARLDAYYGRKGKEDADAGRQTGNGSEE